MTPKGPSFFLPRPDSTLPLQVEDTKVQGTCECPRQVIENLTSRIGQKLMGCLRKSMQPHFGIQKREGKEEEEGEKRKIR